VPALEPAAALKNLTAVGAVVAAGIEIGGATLLLNELPEQVPVFVQAAARPVICDAVVGRVLAPLVKVVEVIVRFQPAALPVRSLAVIGMVNVGALPIVPAKL